MLFLLTAAQGVVATPVESRLISVHGQCIRKVSPDRGSITIVSQFLDKNSQQASKRAMALYEKMQNRVEKMKLKDLELQTSEYSLQEVVDYQKDRRVSRGTQASIGLQVITSEITRLGEVAALAAELEVGRVEQLSTFLSREKTKNAREACLVEAIQNARDKAEKMAASAKAKVGEVQLIDENPITGPNEPGVSYVAAMARDGGMEKLQAAPRIEAKPETIQVQVLVKFALK